MNGIHNIIDLLRSKQTVHGDCFELLSATSKSRAEDIHANESEDVDSVKSLCAWWNTKAPADQRCASAFRVYIWSDEINAFHPCDGEEPVIKDILDFIDSTPSYSLFEFECGPVVLVKFLRGKAYDVRHANGVDTFAADGQRVWTYQSLTDEARYSIEALELLREMKLVESFMPGIISRLVAAQLADRIKVPMTRAAREVL